MSYVIEVSWVFSVRGMFLGAFWWLGQIRRVAKLQAVSSCICGDPGLGAAFWLARLKAS